MSKFSIIGLNALHGCSLADVRTYFAQFGGIVPAAVGEGVKQFGDGRWTIQYSDYKSAVTAFKKSNGRSSETLLGIGQGPFRVYFGQDTKSHARNKKLPLPESPHDPTAACRPKARPKEGSSRAVQQTNKVASRSPTPSLKAIPVKDDTPGQVKRSASVGRSSPGATGQVRKKPKLVRRKLNVDTASLLAKEDDTRERVLVLSVTTVNKFYNALECLKKHVMSSLSLTQVCLRNPFESYIPDGEALSRTTMMNLGSIPNGHVPGSSLFIYSAYHQDYGENMDLSTSPSDPSKKETKEDQGGGVADDNLYPSVLSRELSVSNTGKVTNPTRSRMEYKMITKLFQYQFIEPVEGLTGPAAQVFLPSFMKPKEITIAVPAVSTNTQNDEHSLTNLPNHITTDASPIEEESSVEDLEATSGNYNFVIPGLG